MLTQADFLRAKRSAEVPSQQVLACSQRVPSSRKREHNIIRELNQQILLSSATWCSPLFFGICDSPKGLVAADGSPQSGRGSRIDFRVRCCPRAAECPSYWKRPGGSRPSSVSSSSGVPVQPSGVASAGFSLSPERLPEADSVPLDKWVRIG